MSKVIVIGAGASGLIAAIKASEKNEVILLEKNDKCGKKLLLTGNGKCNYWHENINVSNYHTDDAVKLNSILSHQDEVFTFLTNLGIYPRIKNGYYYPNSNQAASVKEVLEKELKYRNIMVKYNFEVKDIEKENNYFKIISDTETLTCDKVILASGSKAFPKTGSDGFAYVIVQKFNLKINSVLPALTGLKCNELFLKDWNGIRTDANLSLYVDNKMLKEETGEVQLTDTGISGICTFNISGEVSRALNENKDVQVKINFVPFVNEDFKTFLNQRSELMKNYKITEILESVLNYKLTIIIMKKANINVNAKWNDLTDEEKNRLTNSFENFTINITGTNSFDKAQVCTGGVSLSEINEKMETKKIENLYLTGEELDVDGICGGYNLAFAFITGYIAGKEV